MDPAGPLRIFIADDSKPVTEMLVELVTSMGRFEVVGTADSEASALESIGTLKPDVIVVDLQLKSGSGNDVVRGVRADPALAGMHVIVMSNHASPGMRAGCLKLGADDFFDKLLELPAFLQRLGELADAKR
jgi:CheY-like chemotaxis protein